MLNRTAYSRFPPYASSECSGKNTCVQRRKRGGCQVPVACDLRTGASLLLIAAITSCVLFIHCGTPLVAAAGSLRARSDHGAAEQADDTNSQRQAGPALAPLMLKDDESAKVACVSGEVRVEPSSRMPFRDTLTGASQGLTSETIELSRQPGLRGAAHPKLFLARAAEGAEGKTAPAGILQYDMKARVDVSARLADEGRRVRGPLTDSLAERSVAERHFQHWPAKLYPAERAQRAEDERREGKDAQGDREAVKREWLTVLERTAFPRKEARAEVERTEAKEEHEEDAKWMQSSAAREHRMDYEEKQEKTQGGEEGKREEEEDVEKKEVKEDNVAERKEEERRQSSKVSADIQTELRPAFEKEERPDVEEEGRPDVEKEAGPDVEKEGRPDVEKEGHSDVEKEGRPASEEGQKEEKDVQRVYTRSFLFDHPFCLFPNSPWCAPDLTAQAAKPPEGVPDFIRRANAFVSTLLPLPLPFIYVPLSIPRFWSGEETTSVESAAAPRCRLTFTVPAKGHSQEVLLYMIPSQRLIGLTVGRNMKRREKTETYSRVFDTETRMHAVSSFGKGCKASDKYLQAGLIGWSYAGTTDSCEKILVTLPSAPHAKELMERKELSEEAYKKFVEEEGLDQLTPSEKCVLSGRTKDECEQLKVEAAAKREAPITVSADGYAQNEVRIPEFVYE